MKLLITGSNGFVGKNLCSFLYNIKNKKDIIHNNLVIDEIYEFDVDTDIFLLNNYCKNCDFVFNLAGVNRPQSIIEFMEGNFGFTSTLLSTLKKYNNNCPIMISSSIQAELDNDYGKSKKAGEDLLFKYSKETGARILVYRFPNLFGKWCKTNYNSVIATFCNNIACDLPIKIDNRENILNLCYIDDVIEEMINALNNNENRDGNYCKVKKEYKVSLGEIVDLLNKFHNQSNSLMIPSIPNDSFEKKLYSTYLSYLPKKKICYPLKMNIDYRGSFTEVIKTMNNGQISVNISKPGITKGEHWHNSKWELFIVISGHGLIQERRIGTSEILEFEVTGDEIKAIYMLPGYTHNIINLSNTENLITLMWANELFDSNNPDTFSEKVVK